MKLVLRAALAALTAIMAASALLLPSASPAFASPTLPAPNPALLGTWANTNPATAHILDVIVTPNAGGGLLVDTFDCSNSPACEQGNIPGIVYGANVGSATTETFTRTS